MTTVYAYERVSTGHQDLQNQRVVLEKWADAKGLTIKAFYGDVCGYPYTRRPQFDEVSRLLKRSRPGVDGILVFRIDRLGRTARDASFFIEDLTKRRGLQLFSVHESFDTTTAIGRAMLEIILVLNQLEREQISEATKQQLAAARAAGKRLGRPPLSRHKRRRIEDLAGQGLTPWQIHRASGYSVAACYKYRAPSEKQRATGRGG